MTYVCDVYQIYEIFVAVLVVGESFLIDFHIASDKFLKT